MHIPGIVFPRVEVYLPLCNISPGEYNNLKHYSLLKTLSFFYYEKPLNILICPFF